MQRAGEVNMVKWQSGGRLGATEEEIHICGTAACFAGWIAVSPEWKADGGTVGYSGAPEKDTYLGRMSIAYWLEIPHDLAGSIVLGDTFVQTSLRRRYSLFYNKSWSEVNKEDVLSKLIELREKGLMQFLADYQALLIAKEMVDFSFPMQREYAATFKKLLTYSEDDLCISFAKLVF